MAAELESALARIAQWKAGLLQGLPEARAGSGADLEEICRALEQLASRLRREVSSDAERAALRQMLRDFQQQLREVKALWAQWRDFDQAAMELLRNEPLCYAADGRSAFMPPAKQGSVAWEG